MDTNDITASLIVDAEPTTPEPEAPVADEEQEVIADDAGTDQDVETDDEIEDEDLAPEIETGESYTFKVDGQELTVSTEDLIKAYSLEGATQNRLQEASKMRATAIEEGRAEGLKSAQAEIETKTRELATAQQELSATIGLMGNELFAPKVPPPDPELRNTDPLGYSLAVTDWQQDQGRIQGLQQQLVQASQQQSQKMAALKAEAEQAQKNALRQKRPDLQDAATAQTFTSNVRLASEKLGFSIDEVNAVSDHRILLALDQIGVMFAGQQAEGPTPAQRIVEKAKKTLTPGAVVYKRNAAQKKRRAERDTAKSSGSYKDVAKLLITDAPRKRN